MKTLDISPIKLLKGPHSDTAQTGSGCFMNVIAYLNGEPQITDRSECVCVTIRPIAIWLNDYLTDSQRHRLLPFVQRAMGTSTNDFSVLLDRCKLVAGFAEEMAAHAKVFATSAAATHAAYAADAADAARAASYAAAAADAARAASFAADAADAAVHAAADAADAARAASYAAAAADAAVHAAVHAVHAAADAADAAADAADAAVHAAVHAAANRQLLIKTAFRFMEAICPPLTGILETAVVARAEQLVALATQSN